MGRRGCAGSRSHQLGGVPPGRHRSRPTNTSAEELRSSRDSLGIHTAPAPGVGPGQLLDRTEEAPEAGGVASANGLKQGRTDANTEVPRAGEHLGLLPKFG